MRGARNNVLAGGLVVVSIIAVVVVVILLAGAGESLGQSVYKIRFTLTDGVTGLERGAKVRIGGMDAGTVKSRDIEKDPSGAPKAMLVRIGLRNDVVLHKNAIAYLQMPLLGSNSVLNFPSLGDGEAATADDTITGKLAPPTFLSQAGYGDEQATQVRNIIAKASGIADKFDTISTDLQTVIADARGNWMRQPDGWSARVESITKNADITIAKAPQLADDLQNRLNQLKDVLASAQGYLDENRENVNIAIAKARSIMEKGDTFMDRLNGQLADTAKAFLDQGTEAFAKGESALEKLEAFINEEKTGVRRTLANLRLSSDQLRDMLLEVRRSPWRLLYRPDTRELEYELLYDSARTYAGAISDLRAATDSLNSVAQLPEQERAGRAETVARLMTDLEAAMKRVSDAETAFMKELTKGQ